MKPACSGLLAGTRFGMELVVSRSFCPAIRLLRLVGLTAMTSSACRLSEQSWFTRVLVRNRAISVRWHLGMWAGDHQRTAAARIGSLVQCTGRLKQRVHDARGEAL